MIYSVRHQNKENSEQSAKFLCHTDEFGVMHQITAISGQSSKILCNTNDLWCFASKLQFQHEVLKFFVLLMIMDLCYDKAYSA